jgi:hypothetical protein
MADDAIVVTTETKRGISELRGLTILMWLVGVFCIAGAVLFAVAPPERTSRPPDRCSEIVMAIMCAVAAVLAVALPRFVTRGTWRLDGDGIHFSPLRGSPRSMSWHEVTAIRPGSEAGSLLFRTGKQKLPLNLRWETPEQQEAAISFLRSRLGASFDIFDRCPAKTSIPRILRASGITVAVTLLWFAALIVPSYYLQYEHWQRWVMIWMPLPLLFFFPWLIIFACRQRAKLWSHRKPQLPPTKEQPQVQSQQ